MGNPLTDLFTPQIRKVLYAVYTLVGIVLAILGIADYDVTTALEIYAYVGVALGLTAASNVKPPAPPVTNLDDASYASIIQELEKRDAALAKNLET